MNKCPKCGEEWCAAPGNYACQERTIRKLQARVEELERMIATAKPVMRAAIYFTDHDVAPDSICIEVDAMTPAQRRAWEVDGE